MTSDDDDNRKIKALQTPNRHKFNSTESWLSEDKLNIYAMLFERADKDTLPSVLKYKSVGKIRRFEFYFIGEFKIAWEVQEHDTEHGRDL